jgi:putative membrane protein
VQRINLIFSLKPDIFTGQNRPAVNNQVAFKTRRFFISFYLIGCIGFIFPLTFDIFVFLIPFTLLFATATVLFFHRTENTFRDYMVFAVIFIAGCLVEVAGVNTGHIFGDYYYGSSLGIKLWKTPLMIGINWVLLVYCTASVASMLNTGWGIKILAGSLLMVMYDLVVEQVAPTMDMWYWSAGQIPFRNFLAWFCVAMLFHSVLRLMGIACRNAVAATIFLAQLGFFLVLMVYFKFLTA